MARLFQPPSIPAAHSSAAPTRRSTAHAPTPNCHRFFSPVMMVWPICCAICCSRPVASSRLNVSSRKPSLPFSHSKTPECAIIRRNLNHMSAKLESMPSHVCDSFFMAPPYLALKMPASTCWICARLDFSAFATLVTPFSVYS